LFFAVNQRIDVVRCELKIVAVSDCVGRTGLDAIAAKDAAGIVDVIHGCVALAGGNPVRFLVFGRLDINTIRGTRSGTEEAADALFEAVLITLQNVNPSISRLNAGSNDRKIFSRRLLKHRAQSDAETLYQRNKRFADFSNDRCHGPPL